MKKKISKRVFSFLFFAAVVFCLMSNAQEEKALRSKSMEKMPAPVFTFMKKFPMNAKATLAVPKEFGGKDIVVTAKGYMTFLFLPTENPQILHMKLINIRLKSDPFGFGKINVKDFVISLGDLQTPQSYGKYNLDTGDVTLKFVLTLSPEIIPELRSIGVKNEFNVEIEEKGKMDIKTGSFETHSKQFGLPGGFRVFGGQWGQGCKTEVHLYINVETGGESRRYVKEVWVCPGERVRLFWDSSNATSCSIDQGIGSVALNGYVIQSPTTDTTYKITASGSCDETDSVKVHVLRDGDSFNLTAQPNFESGIWYVNIPATICSAGFRVTSITPVSCGFGAGVWPSWACQKIDPDGTTHLFNIVGRTSPGDFPLVGDWTFAPITTGTYLPQAAACFSVTIKCR